MTRVVLDTNVILSGFINWRSRPGSLVAAAGRRYELVWTAALVVECDRALAYPKVARRFKDPKAARAALAKLASLATLVDPDRLPALRVVEGDPDGDVLFATALAGGARFIVSGDKRVLAVGSFAGVQVVGAAGFLAILGEE